MDVAVVGGSLGGLTTALVLRDIGFDVTVYERSPTELSGFGAGIVIQDATVRYLVERLGIPLESISVPSRALQYLGARGEVTYTRPSPYRFTAWNTIYRGLFGEFGSGAVRFGQALVDVEAGPTATTLRFASGETVRADLAVLADGVLSTARQRLLPGTEPVYAGYVGWRGTVSEALLSESTFAALRDAITYGLAPQSHIVAYQIPSLDGRIDEGERLVNFVWYRNVAEGDALDDLMTDRDGVRRPLSLHPGSVQDRHVEDIRRTAEEVLSPPLAEMVVRTPQPFVQAIVDVESPRMVFGRACLIGDAAFAARPHAGAGAAKAAENGWKLAEAIQANGGDVDAALAAWEPRQIQLGRNLVERSRDIGERSQSRGAWVPGDPDLRFGLYGPGR